MFLPGSNDCTKLDLAMRSSLASSLTYVQSVVGSDIDISSSEISATADRIRQHRIEPGVFGRFFKLVTAVEAQQLDEARAIFRQIVTQADREPAFQVVGFTDDALGHEKSLYSDLIDRDPTGLPWISAPNDLDFIANVFKALELLDSVDQALAQELRGLMMRIVGASPSKHPGVRGFGSASSFMLWGLVVFNVERYRRVLDIIEALVHESAHLLLYAHSIDEPLVTNPVDARYSSPLRTDPRPMDGVFHATFVAARMHYVTQALRGTNAVVVSDSELRELDERLETIRNLYLGGLETVECHGLLTTTGARIIGETKEYMKVA